MKTLPILLCAIISCVSVVLTCYADSPRKPFPYVETSYHGRYFFKMIPGKPPGLYANHVEQEPFGVAYKVEDNGNLTKLWKVSGWYAFSVFLSKDGQHLVRMGPWNLRLGSFDRDLAIAFYKNGTLLKQYSVADLVENESMIRHSFSHYQWLSSTTFGSYASNGHPDPEAKIELDWDMIFHLRTIDGILYEFDSTTGEIKSKQKSYTNPLPVNE